jgi:hypothetical protein
MRYARLIVLVGCCALLAGAWSGAGSPQPLAASIDRESAAPQVGRWYFAVSGDSRDCGDVIMPRIAQLIADNRKANTPVTAEFYWHLGDLRAIYRVDCDMAKRKDPQTRCAQEEAPNLVKNETYFAAAWLDYVAYQIRPFEKVGVPFVLGIGNHELATPKTRADFQREFAEWLTQERIQKQRQLDRDRTPKIPSNDGDTYFHFVLNNVDFIYLDNADAGDRNSRVPDPTKGFSAVQLKWFQQVLQADLAQPSIKTIIVGMHAALPFSSSRGHAMDSTCSSFCSGIKAYDILWKAKSQGKQVYVLASHSHYFAENIYNSNENSGKVIPGWIVGTAGAEQYQQKIKYGYLLVTVNPDGTIETKFQDVLRDTASVVPRESTELLDYCFESNKEKEKTAAQKEAELKSIKNRESCDCN